MDDIKNLWNKILERFDKYKDSDLNTTTYWKIIISLYLILFILLIVGGWMFYGWAVSDTAGTAKSKSLKSEVTMEEIRKVEDITTERKDKLGEVLKQDVTVVGLK